MEPAGRTRKIWRIVLAALALAAVVAVGFLAGSGWASVWLAALFVIIVFLATVVADHGWRGLGLAALKVIVGMIVVLCLMWALSGSTYGFIVALVGAGMLYFAGSVPGIGRLPRSKITAAALLPPPRRRGATLISVIVAMGIVTMTMTLALRAHYQGSRFVALETQRTVAAAECQAQLEQARARGWARLPGVGEHEFVSQAGEGLLTIAAGPVAGSRSITARVSWPRRDDIPAGSVELATIMSARGASG